MPTRTRRTRRPLLGWERCEDRTLLDSALFHLSIADPPPVDRPLTGTAEVAFSVTLDPANIEQTVTVAYSTADGTAKAADGDYVPASGVLTFDPGVTTQTIYVQVPASNRPLPPVQTFFVNLSDPTPSGFVDIERGTAVGTIVQQATLFHLSVADAPPVARPFSGTAEVAFVVTLDPANIEQTVTVPYSTADGTAKAADGDYVPASGVLTFAPGVTTQTIYVQVPASNRPLPPVQTFFVNLGDPTPSDVDVVRGTAVGTILNPNPLIVVNTADSGLGSLRDAITFANGIPDPAAPVIIFAIPGTGPFTIAPATPLPPITRPMTIDATTQPGFDGSPIVELSGAALGGPSDGFVVVAGASTIRGFAINRFPGAGIVLRGPGNNRVVGNFLGTDVTGTIALGNAVSGLIIDGSPDNTIGGTAAADANLLSGNLSTGLRIQGTDATRNVVIGNRIGTDRGGSRALPNRDDGVFINQAPGNTIGGAADGAGNLISGNGSVGVQIYGAAATGNLILGNRIGTDAQGRSAIPNARDGVFLNEAPGNVVGGTASGAGNLISGNGSVGLQILGTGATGNVVQGNRIGTNAQGDAALPNVRDGIFLNEAPANLIGGTADGAGNLVSGNGSVGVQVLGTNARGNVLQGNRIGTNAAGTGALPNVRDGVFVNGAPQTLVGGGATGAGNLVSGNGSVGVQVLGAGSAGTSLIGNRIGLAATGPGALPNNYGVFLNGAAGISTGAAAIQAQNEVRGNRVAQVFQTVGAPTTATTTGHGQGVRHPRARSAAVRIPRRRPAR